MKRCRKREHNLFVVIPFKTGKTATGGKDTY
jgi:hypothetical protein